MVVSKRMLSKPEAAHYCGPPGHRFATDCPVRPVRLGNADRWDIRDLDEWLDSFKDSKDDTVAQL